MGTDLPVFYNCRNCPSHCCTYPRIAVTKWDVRRLAKRFDLAFDEAWERFTKKGWTSRERVLKHQSDDVFGSACRFLDLETRLCTVHDVRPAVCRGFPEGRTCGYYTFLMSERRNQADPDAVARAYNVPGEWPKLDAGD